MEKIHLVSEERGQKLYFKGFISKTLTTFNKYNACEFSSVEEAQAIANFINKNGSRVYTVSIVSYSEDSEVVKVNIDENKVRVTTDIDTLLFNKNNIMAYPKLMKVLNEVEAMTFKLWFDNTKIFEIKNKEEFILAIKEFLGN